MKRAHDAAIPRDPVPRRWLVVGSGGAGKTTLARRLGDLLALPVVHLDREYWNPGWEETPPDEWAARVDELCRAEAWVMDGNYGGTLQRRARRSEMVIWLDLPPWRCVIWVATFRRGARVRLGAKLADLPELPVRRIRSDRELRDFLDEVRRVAETSPDGADR